VRAQIYARGRPQREHRKGASWLEVHCIRWHRHGRHFQSITTIRTVSLEVPKKNITLDDMIIESTAHVSAVLSVIVKARKGVLYEKYSTRSVVERTIQHNILHSRLTLWVLYFSYSTTLTGPAPPVRLVRFWPYHFFNWQGANWTN
jgi:hypothetical protein